jgi:hypothetical protein
VLCCIFGIFKFKFPVRGLLCPSPSTEKLNNFCPIPCRGLGHVSTSTSMKNDYFIGLKEFIIPELAM